ncbi:GTPase [Geminocystis sp. GBBB08]|uniref:GTPase family protein n=1 Tax=Geminocystis sp. GBBB08 TaxID=2604140 RepID=UPI0027E2EA7A|nr:GTPase [Geminocystis sp. GBBB08]MBL1208388.1 GTPase [Geminocystis sp. GBBB08]
MIRLKSWQWLILSLPIITIISFFSIATGLQIHSWDINWIWAVFIALFVGWRWLLVKWTKPLFPNVENIILEAQQDLKNTPSSFNNNPETIVKLEEVLQTIIIQTRDDAPIWEDLQLFFQRCQDLVTAIAKIYHPEVEYPLLNIYIPQAYGLIRGTVDDMDKWMKNLSPALNQVTIAQGYQGYQLYRKLEPSARKLWQVWNWAQWIINPTVAAAKLASQGSNKQANQELLINLSQVLREVALRNLARQTALLYGGDTLPVDKFKPDNNILPTAKTQTLKEILTQAQNPEKIEQKPINILLVGRTGAGKSSLINTLFNAQTAEVDVLPSTTDIKSYQWKATTGEILNLLDTPGYEQINRPQYQEMVLDYAYNADIILLLNPALDPALQMDKDFLLKLSTNLPKIPLFTIITQVDRLRPIREWQPPYNWLTGNLPKEISIREAVKYRQESLGEFCTHILPLVTADYPTSRQSWHDDILAINILEAIAPAKQIRLARFFRNLEAKSLAATKIIDKYSFQMATSQGLTTLLKSPVLQFISTLTTGSPRLALLLAEKIPIEQLPVVIGKLQLAYDLFSLLSTNNEDKMQFDLLTLWTLLIETNGNPEDDAYALGYALVEFWTKNLTFNQLEERYKFYLK